MGKWTKALQARKLPKLRKAEDEEDPKFQEKVDAAKEALTRCEECDGKGTLPAQAQCPKCEGRGCDDCCNGTILKEGETDPCFQCKGSGRKEFDAVDLAKLYLVARASYETKKAEAKKENIGYVAVQQLLDKRYEDEEIESLKVSNPDGSSYSVSIEESPVPVIEDNVAFMEWIRDNDHEDELRLPWQARNRICNQLFEEGEPDPPGIKLHVRRKIVRR